jgi:MerR family transcriptional regulator, copper efflux regulator
MIQTEQLTVGELAKRCDVNAESIRFYEGKGLLPKPQRSASGYRMYSGETVQRLTFIKHAQTLGFSLKEIKELLVLRIDPKTTCADVRARSTAKMAEIDSKVHALLAMMKALKRIVASCSGRGPVSQCPILDSLGDVETCFSVRCGSSLKPCCANQQKKGITK